MYIHIYIYIYGTECSLRFVLCFTIRYTWSAWSVADSGAISATRSSISPFHFVILVRAPHYTMNGSARPTDTSILAEPRTNVVAIYIYYI